MGLGAPGTFFHNVQKAKAVIKKVILLQKEHLARLSHKSIANPR